MYKLKYTNQFKKSLKRCKKRGLDIDALSTVVTLLQATGTLPAKYKPHALISNYKGCMECHIEPDWLLIWKQNNDELLLLLVDTGTHSDIFG